MNLLDILDRQVEALIAQKRQKEGNICLTYSVYFLSKVSNLALPINIDSQLPDMDLVIGRKVVGTCFTFEYCV